MDKIAQELLKVAKSLVAKTIMIKLADVKINESFIDDRGLEFIRLGRGIGLYAPCRRVGNGMYDLWTGSIVTVTR